MKELFIFSLFLCVRIEIHVYICADLIYPSALNNLIVFRMSCYCNCSEALHYCNCSEALPHGDMGWSAVCDSDIS